MLIPHSALAPVQTHRCQATLVPKRMGVAVCRAYCRLSLYAFVTLYGLCGAAQNTTRCAGCHAMLHVGVAHKRMWYIAMPNRSRRAVQTVLCVAQRVRHACCAPAHDGAQLQLLPLARVWLTSCIWAECTPKAAVLAYAVATAPCTANMPACSIDIQQSTACSCWQRVGCDSLLNMLPQLDVSLIEKSMMEHQVEGAHYQQAAPGSLTAAVVSSEMEAQECSNQQQLFCMSV